MFDITLWEGEGHRSTNWITVTSCSVLDPVAVEDIYDWGALNTKIIIFMKLRENAKPNTVHVVHKLSCE